MKGQGWGGRVQGLRAAVYSLCVLLVFSFILFEVLDIDGSSMSASPNSSTGWAEPSEGARGIQRVLFDGTSHLQFSVPPLGIASFAESARPLLRLPSTSHFFGVPKKHTFRHVLPRAALGELPDIS